MWISLEDIILGKINQAQEVKCYKVSYLCRIQKFKLIKSRMVVTRGEGSGMERANVDEGYNISFRRGDMLWSSISQHGDTLKNYVYFKIAEGVDFKWAHHKEMIIGWGKRCVN